MRKYILIISLSLFLSACGQNEFDQSMRAGKDAIQSGNYEEALKQFDISLIEKPTDKDAQLLWDRSKQELDKKRSKETLAKYQEENSPIYAEYMKIWLDINLTKDVSGLAQKLNAVSDLKIIYNNSIDLGRKYKKYSSISDAHDDFVKALADYINMFEAANSQLKESSQFRVSMYRRHHDDAIQSYKDKIAALKEN